VKHEVGGTSMGGGGQQVGANTGEGGGGARAGKDRTGGSSTSALCTKFTLILNNDHGFIKTYKHHTCPMFSKVHNNHIPS